MMDEHWLSSILIADLSRPRYQHDNSFRLRVEMAGQAKRTIQINLAQHI